MNKNRIIRVLTGIVHGLVLAFFIILAFSLPYQVHVPDKRFPVKGIEFIKINSLKGNLLLPFNWGSYAIWELYPQCKVSIDGRYEEVYDNETFMDMYRFSNGLAGWKRTLRDYRHDIILIRKKSPIVLRMKEEKEWEKVYEDELGQIYLPTGSTKTRFFIPPDEKPDLSDPFSTKNKADYLKPEISKN